MEQEVPVDQMEPQDLQGLQVRQDQLALQVSKERLVYQVTRGPKDHKDPLVRQVHLVNKDLQGAPDLWDLLELAEHQDQQVLKELQDPLVLPERRERKELQDPQERRDQQD